MPQETLVLERFFRPEQAGSYALLPFDLPAGTSRLEMRLTYDHRIGAEPEFTGGNTLDLGLFDARGTAFLQAGFRGWSGSERDGFFITPKEATPGYLAGALPPGLWHILLGLYKLRPEGCSARVVVTLTTGSESSPEAGLPEPVLALPAPAPRRPKLWLCGEMHCHTGHSDGDLSPAELVELARGRGLDFLAVTDHNTTSAQRELARLANPGLLLIRGVEVTTYRGHFNAWGTGEWVDFRVETPAQMQAALEAARRRGAVTACNHPKPDGPAWEYPQVASFDCVEVWNGPWGEQNQAALDFWLGLLRQGRRIPAVCGSDFHTRAQLDESPPRGPGLPALWVRGVGAWSEAGVLEAIRAGHASLSDSPTGPRLDLRAGPRLAARGGDALPRPDGPLAVQVHCLRGGLSPGWLRLWDQREVRLERRIGDADETVETAVPVQGSLYLRAELRGADGEVRALTNPVYIESSIPV